jgi:adenosylcobinamide kinase / adenosylcobinamide-phosphate guanylyltransferase
MIDRNPFFILQAPSMKPERHMRPSEAEAGKLTTLVIGGCRSGKSSHALALGNALPAKRKWFVATCRPQDDEMLDRVRRHREERGPQWRTIESSLDLMEDIRCHAEADDVILIDCLTLWASNLMLAFEDDVDIYEHVNRLTRCLSNPPCPIIIVTNEVGSGIVPDNPLARRYRDLVGRINQQVAAASQRVIWMVAGIAVSIKT